MKIASYISIFFIIFIFVVSDRNVAQRPLANNSIFNMFSITFKPLMYNVPNWSYTI